MNPEKEIPVPNKEERPEPNKAVDDVEGFTPEQLEQAHQDDAAKEEAEEKEGQE